MHVRYLIEVTVIIRLSGGGGGGLQNLTFKKGAYLIGGLTQKSGKYVAKGLKRRLEVLKSESDKMAIKLNYQTRHKCGHAKKYIF